MNDLTYKHNLRYSGEFSEWLEHGTEDQKILEVKAFDNDLCVGSAYFGYLSKNRGGHLSCLEIFVKPEYRRNGIATKIYNLAEEFYQDSCKPYPGHSKDAELFWKTRSLK